MLKEGCLYHDTDQLIFTCKENEPCPELVDYLGDLTDELIDFGENSYISEAVFTFEKSYAFNVDTPGKADSVERKVKGVNLSYENSKKVNFESMKKLVLENRYDEIKLDNRVILRAGDSVVHSTQRQCTFKVNATKRVKIGLYQIDTLPYGY